MSEANTFNCPKCGASLNASGSEAEIACPYCGNNVIVPEELRAPPVRPPQVVVEINPLTNPTASNVVGVSIMVPIVIFLVVMAVVAGTLVAVSRSISQAVAPSSGSQLAAAAVSEPTFAEPTAAPEIPTDIPEPTETPAPTPVPAATPTPFGKMLLKDDFSNPASGWDRKNSTDYVFDYVKNGYRVYIGTTSGGQLFWSDKVFSNASVEVDAKRIAGPTDGWFGVTCRMKDGAGGYVFEASIDGDYLIDKYEFAANGNKETTLTSGTLEPGSIKASDVNHIRGACDGSTLSLFVNEKFVSQTSDGEFTSGGAGFASLTGSSGVSGFDMLFSNLVVKGP